MLFLCEKWVFAPPGRLQEGQGAGLEARLISLICIQMRMAVTQVAEKSLHGKESQMPSSPKSGGRVISSGIRKMTCLMRLRNIDLDALPIDWNRVVETIWKPTNQKHSMPVCRAVQVRLMSDSSVVKARAMTPGKVMANAAPAQQMIVDAVAASR